MGPSSASSVARLGALLLAAALGLGAGLQDDPEERAAEALDGIKQGLKSHAMTNVERGLVQLDELYEQLSPKTIDKLEKAVASVFKTRPRAPREPNEDTRDELIDSYHLAIGLVFERPHGDMLILDALKQSHVKDWPEMRARLIEGLGYRKDPGLVSMLGKLLDDDAGTVAGAAATALGQLSEEPQPVRRDAVGQLIDAWGEAVEAARKEETRGKDTTVGRERLAAVEGPFEQALQRLSRQKHENFEAWEEWYRKHGGGVDW